MKNRYKVKSIILGRKKRDFDDKKIDDLFRPCYIALYNINDPHLSSKSPKKVLEFKGINKINLDNFKVDYLLAGNDLVVNDLEYIEIEERDNEIFLNGKQKSTLMA